MGDRRDGMAATAILVAILTAGLAGCANVSGDLKEMAESFKPKTPGEAAREMVDPYDPGKRAEGTVLIANSPFGGSEVYVVAYREMVVNENDPIVRAVAIRALARHGSPEDVLIIAPHLEDENVQVRWEAAKGLQRLHNPAAVPALLKTARNGEEESDVRAAAVIALGQYPQDRVFQALVLALDARELSVNMAAKDSLTILTGRTLGLDPRAWLGWYEQVGAAEAFAGALEYRYPTYHRDESLFEKMAFWSRRSFEQPAPPVGADSSSTRRTYEDDERGEGHEPGG